MIEEYEINDPPNCETCDDEKLIICPRCKGTKKELGPSPDGAACNECLGSGCVICPHCRSKQNPWE